MPELNARDYYIKADEYVVFANEALVTIYSDEDIFDVYDNPMYPQYEEYSEKAAEYFRLSAELADEEDFDIDDSPFLRLDNIGGLSKETPEVNLNLIQTYADKGNKAAVLALGLYYYTRDNLEQAEEILSSLTDIDSLKWTTAMADISMKKGDYTKALDFLESYPLDNYMPYSDYYYYDTDSYKNNLIYYCLIGECYFKTGDYENAVHYLQEIADDPYAMYEIDNLDEIRKMYGRCLCEKGKTAIDEKNYTAAVSFLLEAIEYGYCDANSVLAEVYLSDGYEGKDVSLAKKYYAAAAQSGDCLAMIWLGDIYYKEKDYAAAQYWYSKVMKNAFAFCGDGYDEKIPVDDELCRRIVAEGADERLDECLRRIRSDAYKSNEEINELFEKAYRDQDVSAMAGLMNYYTAADDMKSAIEWAKPLAKQGKAEALYIIGMCELKDGNTESGIRNLQLAAEKNYYPAMLALGEHYFENGSHNDAADLFERAASDENSHSESRTAAAYQLARCYHQGKGRKEDAEKALVYYEKSERTTEEYANLLYDTGEFYYGDELYPEHDKAVSCFEKAVEFNLLEENRIRDAEYKIGLCYKNNKYGLSSDYSKAVDWLEKAYNHGENKAAIEIAECCLYGDGTYKKNYLKAVEYLKPLVIKKDAYAQYLMGCCYWKDLDKDHDDSDTLESDGNRVFYYFEQSSKNGYAEAFKKMETCYRIGIGTKKNEDKANEYQQKYERLTGKTKTTYADLKDKTIKRTDCNFIGKWSEFKNSNLDFKKNYSEFSTNEIIMETQTILQAYLTEIICWYLKDNSDLFYEKILVEDQKLIDTPKQSYMVISINNFELLSRIDPFEILLNLDIAALIKILRFRFDSFMDSEKFKDISIAIGAYRNTYCGHSAFATLNTDRFGGVSNIFCKMSIAESSPEIKEINKAYSDVLKKILDAVNKKLL